MGKKLKLLISTVIAVALLVFAILPPVFAKANREHGVVFVNNINRLTKKFGLGVTVSIKYINKGSYFSTGELVFKGPQKMHLEPIPFTIYNGPVVMKGGMHFTKGEMVLKPTQLDAKSDIQIQYDGKSGYGIRLHLDKLPSFMKLPKSAGADLTIGDSWLNWHVKDIDASAEDILKNSQITMQLQNVRLKGTDKDGPDSDNINLHIDSVRELIDVPHKNVSFVVNGVNFGMRGSNGDNVNFKAEQLAARNLHIDLNSMIGAMHNPALMEVVLGEVAMNPTSIYKIYTAKSQLNIDGIDYRFTNAKRKADAHVEGSFNVSFPGLKSGDTYAEMLKHEEANLSLKLNVATPIDSADGSSVKLENGYLSVTGNALDGKYSVGFKNLMTSDKQSHVTISDFDLHGASNGKDLSDVAGENQLKLGKMCFTIKQPNGKSLSDCYHGSLTMDNKHMDKNKSINGMQNFIKLLSTMHGRFNNDAEMRNFGMRIAPIAFQLFPINDKTTMDMNFDFTNRHYKHLKGRTHVSFPTGVFFAPKLSSDLSLAKEFFKSVPQVDTDYRQKLGQLVMAHCANDQGGLYHIKIGNDASGSLNSLTLNGKPVTQCSATMSAASENKSSLTADKKAA